MAECMPIQQETLPRCPYLLFKKIPGAARDFGECIAVVIAIVPSRSEIRSGATSKTVQSVVCGLLDRIYLANKRRLLEISVGIDESIRDENRGRDTVSGGITEYGNNREQGFDNHIFLLCSALVIERPIAGDAKG